MIPLISPIGTSNFAVKPSGIVSPYLTSGELATKTSLSKLVFIFPFDIVHAIEGTLNVPKNGTLEISIFTAN